MTPVQPGALRYVLDTNICIFIIKNRPAQVRERFAALRPGEIGISSVTEAELLHGVYKSQRVRENLDALVNFASQMVVLPFDSRAADAYGHLRAELERRGTPIGPMDYQIAATALVHEVVLVTNNVSEFRRVPGLTVEDWTG